MTSFIMCKGEGNYRLVNEEQVIQLLEAGSKADFYAISRSGKSKPSLKKVTQGDPVEVTTLVTALKY